jgi:hypothetical protein
MVHATESHHLKGERFSVVVEGITKGNGQINLPHWHCTFPRHNTVERCTTQLELGPVDIYQIEHVGVEDVEPDVAVHEHLGKTRIGDDGVDDKRVLPRMAG